MNAPALATLTDEQTANPKVRQIVEAAARLFMADGYGATSMDAIAREAGVSKATLYAHFTDKASLFAAIISSECERKAQILWDDANDRDDVQGMLERMARAAIRFGTEAETLAIYRIVVGETGRFPELGRIFYETGPRRVLSRLADYLREASEKGFSRFPNRAWRPSNSSAWCAARIICGGCCGSRKNRMRRMQNASSKALSMFSCEPTGQDIRARRHRATLSSFFD